MNDIVIDIIFVSICDWKEANPRIRHQGKEKCIVTVQIPSSLKHKFKIISLLSIVSK